MPKNYLPKALLLIAMASTAALGCELIVDFDRTKIPSDTADSATTIPDSTVPETSIPTDSSNDAPADVVTTDASDAGADAADAADADQ